MWAASRTLSRVILAAWTACCASPPNARAAEPGPDSNPSTSASRAPAGAAAAFSDSSAAVDLAASTAPAWVPARPVPAQAPWEMALRAPERVATLPLAVLGGAMCRGLRFIEENNYIPRSSNFMGGASRSFMGVTAGAANLGPSVGFSGGVQFNPNLLQHLFTAELAGSTRKYTRTRLAVHRGPATLDYEYDWRPRDPFFGFGINTSEDSSASFAWRQQKFQLTLSYPWQESETKPWASGEAWIGPRETTLRRGRLDPSFEDEFPAQAGLVNLRQERLVYGASVARDTREGAPRWTHGYFAELRAERFDRQLNGIAIRSANHSGPQFTRLSFEGKYGFSFLRDPRTIRFGVRAVSTGSLAGGSPLLFTDLVRLGADDGLESLDLGRFRDRDLLYGSAAYLFPLSRNFEFELHVESGGVYPRMRDARASTFRESYGFSLRPRTEQRILAAIGADWSPGVFVIRYHLGGAE